MANHLINLNLTSSKLLSSSLIIVLSIVIALIYTSNIYLGYRFMLICLSIIIISTNLWYIFNPPITQCDLMLELHQIIIWQYGRPIISHIQQLYAVTPFLAVIKFDHNNKSFKLLIASDATDKNTFKQIMRYIRWKS